jgi:cytochrome c oxidase subunit 2
MGSPLERPDDDWWDRNINRRESIWLGVSGLWSLIIFGWMSAFTRIGQQNPIGETYRVTANEYQEKVQAYKEAAGRQDDALIPDGSDVFIAAYRFNWDGTPVVLETGTEYDVHLSSYDVQHGFSIRPGNALSKQMNFQVLPGYEWVLPMECDDPGTYHVICNEFCGNGHRTMHGTIEVVESL